MRELLNLAATLIEASGATATATERRGSASKALLVMVATAVAALCGVGVLICLLAALWLYELPLLGEVGAPLIVAAVLAAITVIAGLVLHFRATQPPPAPPLPPAPTGLAGLNAASGLFQGLMKSNKFMVLLGAVMIGLAAGEGDRR
jgi:hypothetical protein